MDFHSDIPTDSKTLLSPSISYRDFFLNPLPPYKTRSVFTTQSEFLALQSLKIKKIIELIIEDYNAFLRNQNLYPISKNIQIMKTARQQILNFKTLLKEYHCTYKKISVEIRNLNEPTPDRLEEFNQRISEVENKYKYTKEKFISSWLVNEMTIKATLQHDMEDKRISDLGMEKCFSLLSPEADPKSKKEILFYRKNIEYFQAQLVFRFLDEKERIVLKKLVKELGKCLPGFSVGKNNKYPPPKFIEGEFFRIGMIAFRIENSTADFYKKMGLHAKKLRKYQYGILNSILNPENLHRLSCLTQKAEKNLNSEIEAILYSPQDLLGVEHKFLHELINQKQVMKIFDHIYEMQIMLESQNISGIDGKKVLKKISRFIDHAVLLYLRLWSDAEVERFKKEHAIIKILLNRLSIQKELNPLSSN